jgi:replication-associated recombination protein RarA
MAKKKDLTELENERNAELLKKQQYEQMKHYIWVEKYRPIVFDDIILEPHLSEKFQEYIDDENIPHMLFYSSPGTGKTTISRILPKILKYETLYINASLDNSLPTLKEKVPNFASSESFSGKRKLVIFDECDNSNNPSFLPAMRPMFEHFAKNCSFILICNNPSIFNKDEKTRAVKSRCIQYDFSIKDKPTHAKKILTKLKAILDSENVKYTDRNVADIVKHFFPDIRSMINKLQQHRHELEVDNLIYSLTKGITDRIFKAVKAGDFATIRDIVANEYGGFDSIYTEIYESMREYLHPNCIGAVIMLLEDSQRYHFGVPNLEIHIMDFLWKLHQTASFKE